MEINFIIIIAAIVSLIWFISVLVLLNKIAKYLRLSLQAKYYNGLYIGMKIRHNTTRKEFEISRIDGDSIVVDTGKYVKNSEGNWVSVYETYKRSEITPLF